MTVTLHFHGAAGTVTGSCYRVVHPGGQFLVDCGLFQGNKSVRDLNLKPTPFSPKGIDFLLLTHAHIDHAGLLPKLYAEGWRGPMWMTEPTAGLLEYLLPDGAGIQESEAERETRKLSRRGEEPAKPLYTMADAEGVLEHRRTCRYGEWIEPGPGVRARYWNAGHIIGSASVEVEVKDGDDKTVRLMFSGDIGPDEKVFYAEPEGPAGFDYILCESTYGGREREDYTLQQRREALKSEIQEAMRRGGNLVIPAFAVERSQELLHDIGVLIRNGEIDPRLVALDSPLASKVTGVYRKYAKMFEDTELSADELFNPLPHHRGGGGFQGPQRHQRRGHHPLRFGHGRCRTHQAPSAEQPHSRQCHRALCGLSGAGHAGTDHSLGRQGSAHPRHAGAGARHGALHGELLGPCRPF
jgi:metallo-beta-lactamase family protein